MPLGVTTLPTATGRPVRVSADGRPIWKPVGVTVAWGAVAAQSGDTTYPDGTPVLDGEKALRYGTVLVPVTSAEEQTIDLSGGADPTAGTWLLTVNGDQSDPLAWNISAANLQTAIRALYPAGNATVAKSGFVYTVTFDKDAGNVPAMTVDSSALIANTAETQEVNLSAGDDPTGGTWDMTIGGANVNGIAWNVTAAALQTLLRAAYPAGNVTVSKSGFVYTLVFAADAGNVAEVTADGANLTSAGTITVAVTTTTPGVTGTVTVTIATASAGLEYGGMYGPYDSTASDGRQTLTPGYVGILDMTIKETDTEAEHVGLIEGGLVWRERLEVGGAGEPTLTNLLAALPLLRLTPAE